MNVAPARPGRFARGARALLAIALVATLAAAPRHADASAGATGRSALLGEFNEICYELTLARASLARGEMQDDAFADRILDLFARADSLATLLARDTSRPQGDMADFALKRGISYLIDSLRDNYVGIVGRNGVSFIDADQALKAAAAWRADAIPAGATR
ncbi:MAG: hypothetical protein ACM3JJ_08675 [Hyphomicrobiales bacterium]